MTVAFGPGEDLLIYLRMLAGTASPRQFFDIRWAPPGRKMRRRFVPALRIHDAAALIRGLVSRADVYVGVALRDSNTHGGKRAISGSHLLYVECDDRDAESRVRRFTHSPSMVLSSGSPGHLHLYWCLRERAVSTEVESANRRLALELHGDPASVEIARLLRPPESLNHKYQPPVAVTLLRYDPDASYELHDLTGSPAAAIARRGGGMIATRGERGVIGRTRLDRELLAIPTEEYVRVLAGLESGSSGKVHCPFHRDRDPSLQLYPDGTFYCFGSGCGKGGTIIDFAAAKWRTGTRGRDFLELRRRLASTFQIDTDVQEKAR